MRYISMFSGIEAATMAWHDLGWEPVAFAEIEPFPSAVLKERFPDVPNHGDVTSVDWSQYRGKVDVVVAGCPCQAFSVAGLRRSLADDRGNLTLQTVKAIDAIRPDVFVFENVPGLLSAGDNAFGCFLGALVGTDAALVSPRQRGNWTSAGLAAGPEGRLAWRVLDAQYFGVPQRRRRVFVVRCPRDGPDPAEILFEPQGVRGDSPPSGTPGEGVAATLTRGADSGGKGGYAGRRREDETNLVASCLSVPTLRAGGNQTGGDRPPGTDVDTAESLIVGSVLASDHKGPGHNRDDKIVAVAAPVTARNANDRGDGTDNLVAQNSAVGFNGDQSEKAHSMGESEEQSPTLRSDAPAHMAHTLRGEGHDASEDGTGRGTPLVTGFYHTNRNPEDGNYEDVSPTVKVGSGEGGNPPAICYDPNQITSKTNRTSNFESAPTLSQAQAPHVAFQPGNLRRRAGAEPSEKEFPTLKGDAGDQMPHVTSVQSSQSGVREGDTHATLDANMGSRRHNGVRQDMAVRRLTPIECERLQGFKDDHTKIPWRGKPAEECPDGPRYRAIGNSMAVPVMRFIGERIDCSLKTRSDES